MTRKELLVVAIATLITIIGWVAFDILHARASVRVEQNVEEAVTPLSPNFDLQAIE